MPLPSFTFFGLGVYWFGIFGTFCYRKEGNIVLACISKKVVGVWPEDDILKDDTCFFEYFSFCAFFWGFPEFEVTTRWCPFSESMLTFAFSEENFSVFNNEYSNSDTRMIE